MADRIPTLHELRTANGVDEVELHCNGCGRMVVKSFEEARVRPGDTVKTLVRRIGPCSACGARSVTVFPRWLYKKPKG